MGIPCFFIHVPNHFDSLENTADCILHIISEVESQDLKVADFKRCQAHYEDSDSQIPGEADYTMNFGGKSFKSGEILETVASPEIHQSSGLQQVEVSKIDGTVQINEPKN